MSDARRGLPLTSSHIDKIFPKLIRINSRMAGLGRVRSMLSGSAN